MDKFIDMKYEDVVSLQERMETFRSQEVYQDNKMNFVLAKQNLLIYVVSFSKSKKMLLFILCL